jgi:hypothetical protein
MHYHVVSPEDVNISRHDTRGEAEKARKELVELYGDGFIIIACHMPLYHGWC